MSTKIEWTDEVWNPVTGCDHVSRGCDNCYAERIATRFKRPFIGAVELHEERLDMPLRWLKPRRVFVNSVSDLFHDDVPDEFIRRVWETMETAQEHTFQVLTKRPRRMAALIPTFYDVPDDALIPNVWLGVSVEDQRYANIRIPDLLATPAAVRFLSVEPMLGPVDFDNDWLYTECQHECGCVLPDDADRHDCACDGPCCKEEWDDPARRLIHWVIVGGESGPGARPMHPEWARDLRDRCTTARVPFFFKQWGEWAPTADTPRKYDLVVFRDGSYLEWEKGDRPEFGSEYRGQWMRRVGKSRAGRELDGRTWDEYPT